MQSVKSIKRVADQARTKGVRWAGGLRRSASDLPAQALMLLLTILVLQCLSFVLANGSFLVLCSVSLVANGLVIGALRNMALSGSRRVYR